MKILSLIKPGKLTLCFFFLFAVLASLIPYSLNFTSKISWEESHGIPFNFLQFSVCFGVCNPRRYILEKFEVALLIVDALIWYMAACLVIYGISTIIGNKELKRWSLE